MVQQVRSLLCSKFTWILYLALHISPLNIAGSHLSVQSPKPKEANIKSEYAITFI